MRLVDALAGWGLRESKKYPGIQVDAEQRIALGVEIVLRHVPHLVASILLAQPFDPTEPRGVFRADFGPEDVDELMLHNGKPLTEVEQATKARHVRSLVETPDITPIVCAVQVAKNDIERPSGPFVIYDGWHRSAAWLIRMREGRPYRLIADVIRTKHPLIHVKA